MRNASAWESEAPPSGPRGKMGFSLGLATYRAPSPSGAALLQLSSSARDGEDIRHGRNQKTEHLVSVNGSAANLF